ncbi:Uncharacterized protein TCM_020396 [Theobroma cacao]|uniref:Uncharacterized protein n=1 Tax=Theobroma cacao TaxID=3641 RepID=A0A061EKJ7_THECC|nr:Uncharacterized protein TCM_020396 [Theobroma cacao]
MVMEAEEWSPGKAIEMFVTWVCVRCYPVLYTCVECMVELRLDDAVRNQNCCCYADEFDFRVILSW